MTAPAAPVTGQVEWFDIRTRDPGSTTAFCAALFGWRFEEFRPAAGPGGWTIWLGDREIGLLSAVDTAPGPPSTVVYVFVEDLAGTAARTPALGGSVGRAPVFVDPETGAHAELVDPAGVTLGVWSFGLTGGASG